MALDSRAERRGILGAGVGTVESVGGPIGDGNTGGQLFTLHGFGLFELNSWAAIVGDLTFGLPKTYNGTIAGSDTQKIEVNAFFIDVLGGVYQTFTEGGYLYGAAGIAIGWADRDDTIVTGTTTTVFASDAGTSFGFSFGAGFGLPIKDDIFGFISFRQRFMTAEVETTAPGFSQRADVTIGGPEVAVGVAFGVGL